RRRHTRLVSDWSSDVCSSDLRLFSIFVLASLMILSYGNGHASALETHRESSATFNRQAKFELTFANRDLTWLGDPSSPTALVYQIGRASCRERVCISEGSCRC